MSRRMHKRWTPQQLEQCRALFESGMKAAKIGARFNISGSTVSVMAWQRKWQRKVKPPEISRPIVAAQTQGAGAAAEGAETQGEVAVTAHERAFNERLRRAIADYWRARGRAVELHVEEQGGDLLGIRSKSVNGMPVR